MALLYNIDDGRSQELSTMSNIWRRIVTTRDTRDPFRNLKRSEKNESPPVELHIENVGQVSKMFENFPLNHKAREQ